MAQPTLTEPAGLSTLQKIDLALKALVAVAIVGGLIGYDQWRRYSERRKVEAMTPEAREAYHFEQAVPAMTVDAQNVAQQAVRKALRFPLDATFPTAPGVSRKGRAFTVTGTVTAKNSFGAALTVPWRVALLRKPDCWQVTKVEVHEPRL